MRRPLSKSPHPKFWSQHLNSQKSSMHLPDSFHLRVHLCIKVKNKQTNKKHNPPYHGGRYKVKGNQRFPFRYQSVKQVCLTLIRAHWTKSSAVQHKKVTASATRSDKFLHALGKHLLCRQREKFYILAALLLPGWSLKWLWTLQQGAGAVWYRALSQHKCLRRFFVLITIIPVCPNNAVLYLIQSCLLLHAQHSEAQWDAPTAPGRTLALPSLWKVMLLGIPCPALSSGAATTTRRGSWPCSHQLPKGTGPVQHLELLHQFLLAHLILPVF